MKNFLLEREQYYLDNINPSLNICKIANSPLGVQRDISFSINLSKARRGKKQKVNLLKNKTIPKFITSESILKVSSRSVGIKVKIFNSSNNLVNQFPTLTNAAKHLGVSHRTIGLILKIGVSYANFTYKF